MAVGLALHEGQLGTWNVIINTIYCLGIILMALSGVVMWWKRRPAGSLCAPRHPIGYRVPKAIIVIGLVVIVLFPVSGLALILFAVIDFLWLTGRRFKAV